MSLVPLYLLPILGGYFFCFRSKLRRHKAIREEGQKLYFRAAYHGVFLILFSIYFHCCFYYFFEGFAKESLYFKLIDALQKALDSKSPPSLFSQGSVAIILVYTFFISLLATIISNVPYRLAEIAPPSVVKEVKWGAAKTIFLHILIYLNNWGLNYQKRELLKVIGYRDFELMQWSSWEKRIPILVTLDTGKIYVGYVVRMIDPTEPTTFVRLLPMMSGYRELESRNVVYTTYYASVYDDISNKKSKDLAHLKMEDFEVVVPESRIVSAHLFDIEAYLKHFENQNGDD